MRADERYRFKKIRDGCKARITSSLFVELAVTQELKLRPMERVAVNLPVIQLDGADGLLGREEVSTFVAQTQVAHEVFVLREPARDS